VAGSQSPASIPRLSLPRFGRPPCGDEFSSNVASLFKNSRRFKLPLRGPRARAEYPSGRFNESAGARDPRPIPGNEGHTLIITRRHVPDFFELYAAERSALHDLLIKEREVIQRSNADVVGFNIGVNAGAEAGQTVFDVHVHLIPRRAGDVTDPRGGIRNVIPGHHPRAH
jgi:diadenosine tetraphosphate (Ap4A) HIT family hydrolase